MTAFTTAHRLYDYATPFDNECPACEETRDTLSLVADELRDYAKEWPLCQEIVEKLTTWADTLEDL